MDSVDLRTRLVGQNRLELLLFRAGGRQLYGINVFKVREVLQCPQLTHIPKAHSVVRGVAHIRGTTIPILDLSLAIGKSKLELEGGFVIITEYNGRIQGFLVRSVERIINMNWEDIFSPPKGAGGANYLTSITHFEDQLVEIIDVEKILAEVSPGPEQFDEKLIDAQVRGHAPACRMLVADDSSVARRQVVRLLEAIGVEAITVNDGRQALDYLERMLEEGRNPAEEFLMLISDIEMPEMDGYTLTARIRANPQLKDLYILLHTSLSGGFNRAMVQKVGANDFLSKFHPDELAIKVAERVKLASGGGV